MHPTGPRKDCDQPRNMKPRKTNSSMTGAAIQAANQEDQEATCLLGVDIWIRRNLLCTDGISGQGLGQQEDRHDCQRAHQLAWAWPVQRKIFGEVSARHLDCYPKHGDRERTCYNVGSAFAFQIDQETTSSAPSGIDKNDNDNNPRRQSISGVSDQADERRFHEVPGPERRAPGAKNCRHRVST